MEQSSSSHSTSTRMTEADFQRVASYVTQYYGIKLPREKKGMLESRLIKRLRMHGFVSFREYLDYAFSEKGRKNELNYTVDLITTNKTDFYREPAHYAFLEEEVLPEWLAGGRSLRLDIWSAGCSSGEEVYTLAFVMEEMRRKGYNLHYQVWGTDISQDMLRAAREGVYSFERIAPVPEEIKKRYLLKHKNPAARVARVKSEIREKASFEYLNFMNSHFETKGKKFDIIFFRNVLIYFERSIQERILRQMAQHLRPHGYLFLSHSESMLSLESPYKLIRPAVYQLANPH